MVVSSTGLHNFVGLAANLSGHHQAAVHRDDLTDQVVRIGGSQERYHRGKVLSRPFG